MEIIGAIAWFTSHQNETLCMFDDGTFPTDHTAVTILLSHGIPQAELTRLGLAAMQRGCTLARHPNTIANPLKTGEQLAVFHKIEVSWAQVDGTIPWSVMDEAGRFQRGPPWKDNSCAVDCVMVAALLLNAGRCQADQMDRAGMQTLTEPARVLCRAISKPWSRLSGEDIGAMRDIILQSLHDYDPRRFPLGGYKGITDCFHVLLAGLPQLSYTLAKLYKCADGGGNAYYRTTRAGGLRVKRWSTITMSSARMDAFGLSWGVGTKHTINSLVNHTFRDRILEEGTASNLPKCQRKECPGIVEQDIVVDRLPAVLVLSEDWSHTWMVEKFSSLNIQYFTQGSVKKSACYKPLGCIVNKKKHFMLNWTVASVDGTCSFIHYDGLTKQGEFRQVAGLDFQAKKGQGISLLFYKLEMA